MARSRIAPCCAKSAAAVLAGIDALSLSSVITMNGSQHSPEPGYTLLARHRGSLANSRTDTDGAGPERHGLSGVQAFPEDAASWNALSGGSKQFPDGAQAEDD